MIKFNRLTVRVFPSCNIGRCWIARVRLDDGKPLDEGRNAWIAQGAVGGGPTGAVAAALDLLRCISNECWNANVKHEWESRASARAAATRKPPVPGRYCRRCHTWEPARGR